MKQNQSITKQLITFSIPLILSGLLQQMFNWADAFILGNAQGELALASVGATTAIVNLLVNSILGFTSGITILSARFHGMEENRKQKKLLHSFLYVFPAFLAVISIAGILSIRSILELMHTPEAIIGDASVYLRIIFIGIPFLGIYNIYGSILRGMGNSRTPFLCLAFSGCINVLLDILLVSVLSFGVRGAAIATVLSQILSAGMLLIQTSRMYPALKGRGEKLLDREILKDGLTLAVPITIKSILSGFGSVLLQNFMNGFGEITVAAITTSYRVDSALLLPVVNMGTGIATMVSQSIGAGKEKRAEEFFRRGLILMLFFSLLMSIFIWLLGGFLIGLFGIGTEAIAIGFAFFKRLAAFYMVFGLAFALSGYLEGKGDVMFTSVIGVLSLGVRLAMSYLLMGVFGNMVIAWAEVISWIFLALAYFLRVLEKRCKKELTKG